MTVQRVNFREKNTVSLSFYRPQISSFALSVLVALFLVLGTNQTFWSKFHTNLWSNPGAVAALYVAVTVLFIAAITAFSVKYLAKPLFILLILTAAVASWFTDRFGVVVDSDMI